MKKRNFLKRTEEIINSEESKLEELNDYGEKLSTFIFWKNFNHILIFVIFLFLALLLFNKANKLSFINLNFYIFFVSLFVGFCFISACTLFTLYIYNKRKNKEYSQKKLKNIFSYYQFYDLISFVGLVITIMLWFVMFIATPIEVNGSSMEPTYYEKDKLLVWHLFYDTKVDDVVIVDVDLKYNFRENTEFVIKRVVALDGDKIRYDAFKGIVYVNDSIACTNVTIEQFETMMTDKSTNIKYFTNLEGIVPEGYVIVLGDNRGISMDSRSVGLINKDDILGKCIYRIYPFHSMGIAK